MKILKECPFCGEIITWESQPKGFVAHCGCEKEGSE